SSKTTAEASRRASGWEWAQVALLSVNLAWTTLCLGGFRAETMVVTSALGGALLAVHFAERAVRRWRSSHSGYDLPRLHVAGWLPLPFLVYAIANVQGVTPVGWLGWLDWLGWAHMAAIFWVVLNGIRTRAVRMALLFGLVVIGGGLVLLASYQRFVAPDWLMLGRTQAEQFFERSSGSFGSPNSLAAYLLLLLPAMAALTIRRGATAAQRIAWGYLGVAFGFALALTVSRGAWLALGIVLAWGPLMIVRGSISRKLAYTGGAWLLMGLVAMALYSNVPTVRDRFVQLKTQGGELTRPVMWQAGWSIFRERPLFGSGAGSYGVRFDQHRPESFQLQPRWAHNDYLNTLSDYGIVGCALVFGAWIALVVGGFRGQRAAAKHWFEGPGLTAGLGMGAAAFALQLAVDFSLKIPALAMAFAAVAGMWVQRSWSSPKSGGSANGGPLTKSLPLLAGIVVASATVLWVIPLYRGEAKRQNAQSTIARMAPGRSEPKMAALLSARADCIAATTLSPSNGDAWADRAYVASALAQVDSAGAETWAREAEHAANRALGISRDVADFWMRRGVALDLQGRWVEAGAALVEAMRLAPTRAAVWYQQAVHLSLHANEMGRARAAVGFALRLDPGNPEAHALRERLAERSHAP
ncbi:MAG TPA: O-antigen ligase family protein, partial [Opitutus sp.]|nr:O-antigen ligase family protein [Opitutus sp.]